MQSELNIPNDRLYTKEHTWIFKETDCFTVGISDYAQNQLGEIVYLDLPSVGSKFLAMQSFGTVESLKAVNELYLPIAGEVIAINTDLDDIPTLVNSSPYQKGWIIKIKADNVSDYQKCLESSDYKTLV